MASEPDMNIDYEKLRKAIMAREFTFGFFTGAPAKVVRCAGASDATPELLLSMARRYNIKLDRYRIKKK